MLTFIGGVVVFILCIRGVCGFISDAQKRKRR